MKNTTKITLILVIVWMAIIFAFSNTNSIDSNHESMGIIKIVATKIFKVENEKVDEIVKIWNKPLRKITHFTVYLILSLLIYSCLRHTKIKRKKILTLIICFIYALTDEYHQTFIGGRTGLFSDVIIDTLGSATFIIIVTIKNQIKETRKNNLIQAPKQKKSNF